MLSTSARLVGIPLILVAAFISTPPGVSDGLRAERASVYSSIRSFIMSKWPSKSTLEACDHQKYQILDIARLLFHKSHGSTGIEGACVAFYGLLSRLRLRFLSRKGKFNRRRRMKILHRNDLYSMKTHENILKTLLLTQFGYLEPGLKQAPSAPFLAADGLPRPLGSDGKSTQPALSRVAPRYAWP